MKLRINKLIYALVWYPSGKIRNITYNKDTILDVAKITGEGNSEYSIDFKNGSRVVLSSDCFSVV